MTNASFKQIRIKTDLASLVEGLGALHTADDGSSFLLTSDSGRSPITVAIDGDIVRIRAGFGIRVSVGSDFADETQSAREVVEALLRGTAEEYFDVNGDGEMDAIAWRIWYPRGERTGGVRTPEALLVPLLPW